jgi:quercetin dioxygenase-like cupin family protein
MSGHPVPGSRHMLSPMSNPRWWLAIAVLAPSLGVAADAPKATHSVTLLKVASSWDGTPLTYAPGSPEVTAVTVEIAPGKETGWHTHHVPSFGYLLEGDLEVHLKDGRVKRLRAGDPIVEVVGTLHNGVNRSAATAKIVVFYAGAAGTPLTTMESGAPPVM